MTEPTRSAADAEGHPAQGTVLVRENATSDFSLDVLAGRHRLQADEPADVGGADTGPNPYELLAAALASCTAMTLRMYARRKGWALGRISVSVRHDKIHAEDCEHCETRKGRIDRFERLVEVEGDVDAATRTKLLEIADKCPVHRTLESEVVVTTRMADGGT